MNCATRSGSFAFAKADRFELHLHRVPTACPIRGPDGTGIRAGASPRRDTGTAASACSWALDGALEQNRLSNASRRPSGACAEASPDLALTTAWSLY